VSGAHRTRGRHLAEGERRAEVQRQPTAANWVEPDSTALPLMLASPLARDSCGLSDELRNGGALASGRFRHGPPHAIRRSTRKPVTLLMWTARGPMTSLGGWRRQISAQPSCRNRLWALSVRLPRLARKS